MERKSKKLTLNKETLRDLTSRELDRVAGGVTQSCIASCQWTHTLSCPGCICTNDSCCVC
jgi:hypothetical protein